MNEPRSIYQSNLKMKNSLQFNQNKKKMINCVVIKNYRFNMYTNNDRLSFNFVKKNKFNEKLMDRKFFNKMFNSLLFSTFLFCCLSSVNCIVNFTSHSNQSHNIHPSAFLAQYQTLNETVNFTHVAYDPSNGRLYIGAINNLIQLNSDLIIEQEFKTGPLMDSVLCSASDCDQADLTLTPNIAKLLLIDYYNHKLIFCGSVKQGSCVRHSLNNVSDVEPLIPIPVAANDEHSSTIALITQSSRSFHLASSTPVMYVAATNSKLGPYRDLIPALCTRSLEPGPKLFNVVEKDISEMARLDIEFHLRDYYLVNYVYAFNTEQHVYFATTQPRSASKSLEELGYSSKLARLCLEDTTYNSYAEIKLQCTDKNGEDYPLLQTAFLMEAGSQLIKNLVQPDEKVLLAVFTKSKDHTNAPGIGSAICIYSIAEIEKAFDENIRACLNGTVSSRNMNYIANNIMDCPSKAKTIKNNDLCLETIKLNGSNPLVASSSIVYSNETLTSIAGITVLQHTVALVGTANGHFKKILLTSQTNGYEFEDVTIDEGQPILSDLHIDPTNHYAFVASPYKITKVQIERCQAQNTCRECLQTRNPFCGWCSLEKRCTTKSACSNPLNKSTNRWISLDAQKCIDFQLITPDSLPIDDNSTIELVINQLPKLPFNAHYLCVFNENISIKANMTSNGLICNSPPISSRPFISPEDDHVSIDLAVRSTETKTNFLNRNYTFFDCSVHKSCSSCLNSNWKCSWCGKNNICSSNNKPCSSNNELSKYESNIQNIDLCPKIQNSNEILIPNGISKEIVLEMLNLPKATSLNSDSLICLVEYEQQQHKVPAFLSQNTIKCQKNIYSYKKDQGIMIAKLSLLWNKQIFLDKLNLTLYKCELLGSFNGRSDCSLCLSQVQPYECGWCSGQCRHQSIIRSDTSCISQDNVKCPVPRINWVHPLSGPVEGGTLVEIEGSNLGSSLSEIAKTITIGGIPCTPISYNVSIKVVCQTGRSPQVMQEDIIIGNRAGYTRVREKFKYEQVEVYDFWPRIGPKSGGARLYIQGMNLNIGSSIEVFLDNAPCQVDRSLASSQQISCITPSLDTIQTLGDIYDSNYKSQNLMHPYLATINNLQLKIDNLVISKTINFTYIEDPVIKKISPLKTPISGGRTINVYGTNFRSIQHPKMVVLAIDDNQVLNETVCIIHNDELMACPSPPINFQLFQLIRQEEQQIISLQTSRSSEFSVNGGQIRLKVGFVMGNVLSVRHLTSHHSGLYSSLTYVPDPQFSIFGSTDIFNTNLSIRTINPGDPLIIQGIYLKAANFDENEINVTIGLSFCNITSYTVNQIVCTTPDQLPLPTDELGRKTNSRLPLVVVRMGSFLRYELGYLAYNGIKYDPLNDLSSLTKNSINNYNTNLNNAISISTNHHHQHLQKNLINSTILAIILACCTVILVCVCGLMILKHKNSATEREYKKIQLQMDTLENQVRYECKQAFAELQTNMTDLSKELQTTGIPTLDHRSYVMKVFFPGVHDHPLLINPPNSHTYQQISAHSEFADSLHYHSADIYNKSNQNQGNNTSDYVSYYSSNTEYSMEQFKDLLNNKCFLILFINTLESQHQFSIKDRVNVASLLTIIFMDKMDYLTDILSFLLYQFIEKSVRCNKHPQLMLRRTESVVEKMLSNWLALHMYDYLRSKSGRSLFMLFAALKHQTEKGPVDAVSNEARYSLSEDTLLKENIDYQQIEVQILNDSCNLPLGSGPKLIDYHTLSNNHPTYGLPNSNQNSKFYQTIKLNDCDTISQVKSKILDVIYKNVPYSSRPSINNLDLEWRQPNSTNLVILQDDDSSSIEINGWRRLNTLRHYGVHSNAFLKLVLKQKTKDNLSSCDFNSPPSQCNSDYGTYGLSSVLNQNGQSLFSTLKNNITSSNNQWHLTKPHAVHVYEQTHSNQILSLTNTFKHKNSHLVNLNDKISLLSGLNNNFNRNTLSTSSILPSSRISNNSVNLNSTLLMNGVSTLTSTKNIPEIYLTRLLATKGTTQKFVDDFLGTIFNVDEQFPQAIKWLFDLLDEAARIHGINDPSVVYAWKCNLLPLRFWVNFVKNPELIFDIHKTPTIDSSLGIIAQLLMDICSDNEIRLGKDSPSNKLLFAKDLDVYKNKLKKFYEDIATSMPVTEHEMSERLEVLSNEHSGEFDLMIALKDLYVYASRYSQPLCDSLAGNNYCLNIGLLEKFKQIVRSVNSQSQCI